MVELLRLEAVTRGQPGEPLADQPHGEAGLGAHADPRRLAVGGHLRLSEPLEKHLGEIAGAVRYLAK